MSVLRPLPHTPSVSIVIAAHNEGPHLARTLLSLLASLPAASEILVVDDGSTDASTDNLADRCPVSVLRPPLRLGSARARNFGAAHIRGDIVVFSDAHVEVPPDWAARLLPHLARAGVGAIGPVVVDMARPHVKGYGAEWSDAALTWSWLGRQGGAPYAVPMLGAFFLAMRREVFEVVGGFDPGIVVWGSEDAELCLRLWTLGYECLVEPSLEVAHLFRSAHPYVVPWQTVFYNQLRLIVTHFGRARADRAIRALGGSPEFDAAYADLKRSDVWQRRAALRTAQQRDTEWFCQRFGMLW